MYSSDEAARILEETVFPPADSTEMEILHKSFVHEDEKLSSIERTIFDITRANFAFLGAVVVLGSASFVVTANGGPIAVALASFAVLLVSIAAAIMVVFYYKYLCVQEKKVKILRTAIWRRRPLKWVELKHAEKELSKEFERASRLDRAGFRSETYVPKRINLIPAGVAVVGLFVGGLLLAKAALGGGTAATRDLHYLPDDDRLRNTLAADPPRENRSHVARNRLVLPIQRNAGITAVSEALRCAFFAESPVQDPHAEALARNHLRAFEVLNETHPEAVLRAEERGQILDLREPLPQH